MTVLGFAITAFSIGLALYFWARPRSAKSQLLWIGKSAAPLVNEYDTLAPGLSVAFRDVPIRRVSIATIKLWNAGYAAVRGNDFRNVNVTVADGEILGAWLNAVTAPENHITLTNQEGELQIAVDFLNRGDGAEITLLHTGAAMQIPRVGGAIIGGVIQSGISTVPGDARISLIRALGLLALLVGGAAGFMILFQLVDQGLNPNPAVVEAIDTALRTNHTAFAAFCGLVMWLCYAAIELRIRYERGAEPKQMVTIDPRSAPWGGSSNL